MNLKIKEVLREKVVSSVLPFANPKGFLETHFIRLPEHSNSKRSHTTFHFSGIFLVLCFL